MFYLVTLLLCAFSATKGQVISGCPLYGCSPGGTFSLDSVITSADVEVAWTAQLENSTTAANVQLGCVSNENNIVCPTSKGYVSLDPKTGKELWRRDILVKPSLPIMDVNGDIIGSDGRSLVMIDGDGTTQPVIKLNVPVDSIYSLNLLDIGAFLIVSKNGEVIAYLINGVPLASLILTGEVDGHDGIFHPMAQPVISGNRAYILTEFKPKAQNVSKKFASRLIAIDVNKSVTDRIAVVWFMELQDQSSLLHQPQSNANSHPPLSPNALKLVHNHTNLLLKFHPKITPRKRYKLFVENNINKVKTGYFFISNLSSHYSDNKLGSGNNQSWLPSLLVQNHIVYLSLSATQITGDTNDDSSTSKMIAIKDLHNQGTVLFSENKPLSYLASVRNQFKQGHKRTHIDSILIWSIGKFNGNILEGVDFMTGQVMAKTNLSASFGEDINITSQLMVTFVKTKYCFNFGIESKANGAQTFYFASMEYDPKLNTTQILSKINSPGNREIVGQIISATTTNNKEYMLARTVDGGIFALKINNDT
ncbi:uncharacterized protein LOC126815720 isoform X1 [Patella vulgata]|uniref:uncharacterized protein LOC126815720 isoform X1 n=1 Tax=Patella vulgata TaxID=6465 RepID=UPI00218030AE|nr:uncharacterized protein LOC126815720 isoform X1 [Patella vulgata]